MNSFQNPAENTSFIEILKALIPRNQLFVAIIFEFIILASIGSGSYAVLSLTGEKTLKQNAVVTAQSAEEAAVPTSSPTPSENLDIYLAAEDTPTPTFTPTPTTDPAAGWPSYTNSVFSYSVKYPPDWKAADQGALEPKTPSYVVFNPQTATQSARSIAISVSTRTYQEQLDIVKVNGKSIIVAGITGTQQDLQDSGRNQTTRIIIPGASSLYIFDAKKTYSSTLTQMLETFKLFK